VHDQCMCGLHYKDFRTGYKYRDIYEMLWSGSDDSKHWKYKRRNTVLGLWHMIKMQMWESHVKECEYLMPLLPFREEVVNAIPF
jgi:hypothetical protein